MTYTWSKLRLRTAAVAAVAILLAVFGATARAASAQSDVMTPAVGSNPPHEPIPPSPFASTTSPSGAVHFGCQTDTTNGPCYGPDQIRTAYYIQPLLNAGIDGSGRTIAIIDAFGSPTLRTDLRLFSSVWTNISMPTLQVFTPFGVAAADPSVMAGWAAETSLDVQWAHVVAPGAKINLIVARSSNDADILDATQYVIDHRLGDVISQSYGEAEQCMAPALLARQHQLFEQATAQNITLIASSGDSGAAQPNCDGTAYIKAVSTPASDPLVTGVGGTDLVADGVTGKYQSESVWNESVVFGDAVASGGGYSMIFKAPDYQQGVVHSTMRGVPDVAYTAGVFRGVIVAWGGAFYRFGGTSVGSPQWAGIVALADQLRRGRVGFINPTLYATGQSSGAGSFFRDVTRGSNSIPAVGQPGTPVTGYSALPGWDAATGWGSPKVNNLVPLLAASSSGDHSG